MSRSRLTMIGSFAWLATAAFGQVEDVRLTPATSVQSDILGYKMDLDGDVIVGGCPFPTLGGLQQAGRAIVFERIGEQWQEVQTLRQSVVGAQAWFGIGVSVDGDTMAIGASGEATPSPRTGAAYIFEKQAGVWTETARLTNSDSVEADLFGNGMALDGDTLFVGANGQDIRPGFSTGAVYKFERSGGVWTETAKLTALDQEPFDNFGFMLARHGEWLIVSSHRHNTEGVNDAGAAYVFRNVGGVWEEFAKLAAPVPDRVIDAFFSEGISIDGNTLVVGAPGAEVAGLTGAGAVYVFTFENGAWGQTDKLTAPNPIGGALFGRAVAIDRDTILVGAFLETNSNGGGAGAAYVYHQNAGAWEFDTEILASVPGNLTFGWTVDLEGDRGIVSAPFFQANRGAIFVYSGLSGVCIPGDLNGDGMVDLADLGILLADFGCTGGSCAGDIDGDGDTDLADLGILLANFGQSCP